MLFFFFFFNDTATTEIYTLSLHDALPISGDVPARVERHFDRFRRLHRYPLSTPSFTPPASPPHRYPPHLPGPHRSGDRKSTRLNSSHLVISYAVFCLKKKTNTSPPLTHTH